MSETAIQASIRKALGKQARHTRMFRNNRGKGWTGPVVQQNGRSVTIEPASRVEYGFVNGAHDLIGWTSVIVTPDMVGRPLAIFTSIETKTATGPIATEQQTWRTNVLAAGGIAGIARTDEDALVLIRSAPGHPA